MRLFAHQKQALDIAKEGNLALFHDCGTGKTCTALNLIKHHRANGSAPALVVCPLSIIDAAWIEDCKKFTPELSIVSLWSKKPADRKARLAEDHDIYVTNFETLKYLYEDICDKLFDILIVDESSKMKNPKSQITKALLSLAGIHFRGAKFHIRNPIPLRYCLSGTPAPNDESEYWGQVKFITGPGNKCFHGNYYAFRSKYFNTIPLGITGQKIFKFRQFMRKEFMDAMKPITHVVRKEDALDLPEQIHEIRKVFLGKEEQKAYDTLKSELILRFENEQVLATTALVEVLLLREITSGFCYIHKEEKKFAHQIGKSKLTELKSMLEEIGDNQTIVWVNFRYEVELLLKELPGSQALYGGTENREQVIKDFQDGKIKTLVCVYAAAAHGLTFVNCSYAIYFSLTYSYEMIKQSQDRLHRIGQKKKVTYFYLIANKTIDEVINKIVNKKGDLSREILTFLRNKS